MDMVAAIYTIFFVVMGFAFLVILFVIAGKDILQAFKRRFMKKGCEVYMVNTNRNITHKFLTPKDGKFMIDNLPYVTNPDKTMNLDDEDRTKIVDSLLKKEEKLMRKIAELTNKYNKTIEIINSTKNEKQKFSLMSMAEHLKKSIQQVQDQLKNKQQNYFKDKRPAFFYIEGDPVPKDFHEWYSTLDSKIIDNLVSRHISEPADKKREKDEKMLKLIALGALFAAGIAAIMAFQNSNSLTAICKDMGLACNLLG